MATKTTPKQQPKAATTKETLPLTKHNYLLIAIGFGIIVLGYILMIGGKSDNPDVFNPEIFSFRRITLAPMIVLLGFVFEIYAIMWKPKKDKETNPENQQ